MDWCSALSVNELKRLLLDCAVLTTGSHTSGNSERPARSQTKYMTKYNTHEVSPYSSIGPSTSPMINLLQSFTVS